MSRSEQSRSSARKRPVRVGGVPGGPLPVMSPGDGSVGGTCPAHSPSAPVGRWREVASTRRGLRGCCARWSEEGSGLGSARRCSKADLSPERARVSLMRGPGGRARREGQESLFSSCCARHCFVFVTCLCQNGLPRGEFLFSFPSKPDSASACGECVRPGVLKVFP